MEADQKRLKPDLYTLTAYQRCLVKKPLQPLVWVWIYLQDETGELYVDCVEKPEIKPEKTGLNRFLKGSKYWATFVKSL